MPRARGSEVPQRPSPRGPPPPRMSSSDSDPSHRRPVTDRSSPKVGDLRRSPRSVHSDPTNQKKLGTRIATLESQLDQAQEELKVLKQQLASAEAAKTEAQKELETKKPTKPFNAVSEGESNQKEGNIKTEIPYDNEKETDVFEVFPVEKNTLEPKVEVNQPNEADEDLKAKPEVLEPENPSFDELAAKNDEISALKEGIEGLEKEIAMLSLENESLRTQLIESNSEMSSAKAKEQETDSRLHQLGEELEGSRNRVSQLGEKLKEVEGQKESLEAEMKKLRVQTEQWRKAADAAAAVLAGEAEINNGGRELLGRCASMEKQCRIRFDATVGGYVGLAGSPCLEDDTEDGFRGVEKKKGSSLRMFGDLWKKKGQK